MRWSAALGKEGPGSWASVVHPHPTQAGGDLPSTEQLFVKRRPGCARPLVYFCHDHCFGSQLDNPTRRPRIMRENARGLSPDSHQTWPGERFQWRPPVPERVGADCGEAPGPQYRRSESSGGVTVTGTGGQRATPQKTTVASVSRTSAREREMHTNFSFISKDGVQTGQRTQGRQCPNTDVQTDLEEHSEQKLQEGWKYRGGIRQDQT